VIEINFNGSYLRDERILLENMDYNVHNYIFLNTDWMFKDQDLSYTTSFETDYIFFTVTPGEKYTNYEKLYLPFDSETWKYLMITFGCAFLTIFGINSLNRKIRVSNPYIVISEIF
jgi:hypothetical protein